MVFWYRELQICLKLRNGNIWGNTIFLNYSQLNCLIGLIYGYKSDKQLLNFEPPKTNNSWGQMLYKSRDILQNIDCPKIIYKVNPIVSKLVEYHKHGCTLYILFRKMTQSENPQSLFLYSHYP